LYHPSSATARTDILSLWLTLPTGRENIKSGQGTEADAGRPVLGIELGVWDEISKNPKKFEFYG